MGKLIKIIIAFAVILLAAFVIRTVYFKYQVFQQKKL